MQESKLKEKPHASTEVADSLIQQDRAIVVPGEVLATGMSYLPSGGTYRHGDKILCSRLGILKIEGKVLRVIPVSGVYYPKVGDVIVGQVIDILMSGWRIDTNSPYSAVMPLKDATTTFIEKTDDLSKYFALGDYVVSRITNVTSQKLVDVTMKAPGLHKLVGGRLLSVNPSKVPRIIGKQGSMVSLIKEATGCKIVVGQNGIIWLEGDPEKASIATEALQKIEKEAHTSGMTEKIKELLEKRLNVKLDMNAIMEKAQADREFRESHQDNREGFSREGYHSGGGFRGGGGFRNRDDRGDRGRGFRPPRRDGDRDFRGGGSFRRH